MASPLREDLRAGVTGLIVGAIFLLLVLSGIVRLTNQHYAGERPAAEAH